MTASIRPARIGVVGASWRAGYFYRVAAAVPSQFIVTGGLTRSSDSAERVTTEWGVPTTTDIEDFLARDAYDYVVVAVSPDAVPAVISDLANRGVPVLAETPPAPSIEALFALYEELADARVQVAEQYRYQPHHAARLSIARSGLLGEVTIARSSVAHGYHGVSLIRHALRVGFDPVTVRAHDIVDRVTSARGRDAWLDELTEYDAVRTLASLDFGGRTGVYDFLGEQYFSPIRARHISFHGTRGELEDDEVRYLAGTGTAVRARLFREATGEDGDLEGNFLRRLALGDRVLYENGFAPARLNDDELAVAESMHAMARYVETGRGFYSLADASHDQYLSLLIESSRASGEARRSGQVPWAHERSTATTFGEEE